MSSIDTELIKKLRVETGAPILRVKKVLEEVSGDEAKATKILKEEGFQKAAKRAERVTGQGVMKAYTHHSGKIVAVVELLCETDFVAKNELFQTLANDIAMQVASMGTENVDDLMKEEFIKDPDKKIEDLVKDVIAKTGENVQIGRLVRMEIGK